MTTVEFHFVLPTGEPFANSLVEVQLARSSYSDQLDGITMPRPVQATTDVDGRATLELWPSTTMYYVSVLDSASDAGLSYKFIVPEVSPGTVLRLQDIIVEGALPVLPYDEAALIVILDAKATSQAAATAAAASESSVVAAASAAATSATSSSTDASTAAAAAISAAQESAIAATKAAEAAASATAAATPRVTYRGTVASEAEMFSLATPSIGDKVKRTDLNQVFEVIALPITVIGNWLEYGGGSAAPASVYADSYADNYA